MCVTAIVAGASLIASGVGLYTSIQANHAQAAQAQYMERIKRKQLAEQAEMSRLEAGRQELARSDTFNAERSTALAAIGASGLGDHISFFQGIEPSNEQAFNDEIRAIRLNLTAQESQIADGIQVSEYTSQMARFNQRMSNIGAVSDFASDVVGTYSFYQRYKTPTKKAA